MIRFVHSFFESFHFGLRSRFKPGSAAAFHKPGTAAWRCRYLQRDKKKIRSALTSQSPEGRSQARAWQNLGRESPIKVYA